jgi:hypothetical protein
MGTLGGEAAWNFLHCVPVATLSRFEKGPGLSFRDRKLVPGFVGLKAIGSDSGRFLEEDRR